MFERYTDAARRLISLARAEASRSGSPFIETEHLLLALMREENSLLRRILPADAVVSIENGLREDLPLNRSVQGTTDIPLSHPVKRVLAYGSEAAEALRDPHIDSHHLLVGLLKESDCQATHMLEKHAITRQRVLAEIDTPDGEP